MKIMLKRILAALEYLAPQIPADSADKFSQVMDEVGALVSQAEKAEEDQTAADEPAAAAGAPLALEVQQAITSEQVTEQLARDRAALAERVEG